MTQETTPQAPQAASEQEQQSNDTSSQSTMPLQQPSNVSSQSVMPLQQPSNTSSQSVMPPQQPSNVSSQSIMPPQQPSNVSSQSTMPPQQPSNVSSQSVMSPQQSADFSDISVTQPTEQYASTEQEQQSNNTLSQSVMPLQLSPDEQTPVLQERMQQLRLCVVIPTYNNQNTVADVIRDVLRYTSNVIVVNDGSTDRTAEILSGLSAVPNSDMPSVPSLSAEVPSEHRIPLHPTVVSYQPNRGKGYALKRGFDKAEELGFEGAITIDSDGQHFASEIERFVGYAEQNPGALLLGQRTSEGDMPAKNSFANKFSNFWFTVQTAYRLNDTQNGFRLYPLAAMKGLRSVSSRYEAELEMLVRAAWKGIRIIPVPTRVYYPPEGERVTHFRPGKDFFRISVLNTLFTLLAIVYGYPSMFFHKLFAKKKKS